MFEMDIDIKPPLNTNDKCRTCLSQNDNMLSIFDTIQNEPLYIKLNDLSQIQINHDDGLPSLICNTCVKQTNLAFAFRQQVKRVDAVLKQLKETNKIFNATNNIIDVKFANSNFHKNSLSDEDQLKDIKIEEVCLIPTFEDHVIKNYDSDSLANESISNIRKNPIDISNEIEYKSYNDDIKESSQIDTTNKKDYLIKKNIEYPKHESSPDLDTNICALCSEICVNEWILVKHMMSVHKIKKPFTCNFCGCSFTGKRSLEVHIAIKHTKERKFACDSCPKAFIEKRDLNRHRLVHTKPFICEICNKGFSFRQSLSVHTKMHRRSPGKHPCPKCHLLFMDNHQLQRHTKVAHTNETHECPQCNKKFPHKTRLKKHLTTHKDPKDRKWECKFCAKKFNYIHHVKNHERIHTGSKPFLCNKCGKSFVQSHNLTLHLRQHENVLPHACDICEKQFAHPQRLSRHMRTHTGEKPFMCNVCTKCYSDSTSLKKHVNSCHNVNNDNSASNITSNEIVITRNNNSANKDKKITCKMCPATFTTLKNLKNHNLSHSENPICTVCNRRFILASNLKAHLKTHTELDRSHVCKECGTGYKRLDHLKAHHRRIHAKERKFNCTHCSRSFYRKSELTIHLRRHYGEKPHTCKTCNKSFLIHAALKLHEKTHNTLKNEDAINTENVEILNIEPQSNAINTSPCDLSTKNIIFVNGNVIETFGDFANLIDDNQAFIEGDGTNIFLTNIEPNMKSLNVENIKVDNVQDMNNDVNMPTFNVIRSQDGKLLLQLSDNVRFEETPKQDSSQLVQNPDISQNITIVTNKGSDGESICFPVNTTIVYATPQSHDVINVSSNTDMPSL